MQSAPLFLNPSCFSSPTCLLSHVHYPHMQQHLITHAHASLVRTCKHGMLTKLISILALAGTAATCTLTLAASSSGRRRHLLLLGRTCRRSRPRAAQRDPDALPHASHHRRPRASRCRPPARRSAPAAPRTRSYSVVKTQRPRRPLPGLVASAVKHSAAPGRTCSAAPPTPAYKRRRRALHSGHPVLATARKSPRSRSALTAALSSLSSSSL